MVNAHFVVPVVRTLVRICELCFQGVARLRIYHREFRELVCCASDISLGGLAIAGTVDVATDYKYHNTVRHAIERGADAQTIRAIERPKQCLATFGSFAAQALTTNYSI